jgi:hypothetical protein
LGVSQSIHQKKFPNLPPAGAFPISDWCIGGKPEVICHIPQKSETRSEPGGKEPTSISSEEFDGAEEFSLRREESQSLESMVEGC